MLGHRPVHLIEGQLKEGGISPQSNAKIGEAQGKEGVLAPLHPGQVGGSDGGARGDAGGQTGVGGLVPGKQPRLPAQGPQLGLGDAKTTKNASALCGPKRFAVCRIFRRKNQLGI